VFFEIRFVKIDPCVHLVLHEFVFALFIWRLDSSFWDRFDSFLLCWVDLWRGLSLSTKGIQSIPHEITDRVESWSRVWNWCFPSLLDFPVICLILGNDLLGVAYQLGIDPLCKGSNHSEVFWSSFGLEIDFSREQLVNTRRVRYWYRTCSVFSTFEFRIQIWWRPSLWFLEAMVKISWFLDTIC
jgi:hypothetical protein